MRSAVLVALVSGCATGASSLDPLDIDAAAIDATPDPDAATAETDAAATDAATADAAAVDAPPTDAAPTDAATDAPTDASPPDGGVIGTVDTCAQAYDLTAQARGAGVTVNGSTVGYANNITMATACTGYATLGPDAIYRVDLLAGQTLQVTADPTTTWDISLLVVTPCDPSPACLAGDDNGLSGTTETVTYTATAATSAFIVVDGYTSNVVGPYALTVRVP